MVMDIVIPVCNQVQYTQSILSDLCKQTVMPKSIILIDNGSTDATPEVCERFMRTLPLVYLRNDENIGVNAAWNMGLDYATTPIVGIWNNDIVIPQFFVRKIGEVFERYSNCGYVAPRDTGNPEECATIPDNADNTLKELPNRKGWAFSLRRDVWLKAGPIPDAFIRNFFGDDYLFMVNKEQGYVALEMTDNPVHHYLSRTLYASGGADYCGPDAEGWRAWMATRKPKEKTKDTARRKIKVPKKKDVLTSKETAPVVEQTPAAEKFDENVGRRRKQWRHWTEVPMHIDMSPYAEFYQQAVKSILPGRPPGERKTLVEIGSRYGCSARIIFDAMKDDPNAKLILIDLALTGGVKELIDGAQIEFWEGNGNAFASQFVDDSVDLLHIDADPHEYEQTKELFNNWASKIRVGGVVLFHDCTPFFGVHEFVTGDLAADDSWIVRQCEPAKQSPISAPAMATRIK